jgi:hypothetical protein
MTYKKARNSGKPFNRKKYKDGWYIKDRRNVDISEHDLSQRFWSEEDLKSKDWVVKGGNIFQKIFQKIKWWLYETPIDDDHFYYFGTHIREAFRAFRHE